MTQIIVKVKGLILKIASPVGQFIVDVLANDGEALCNGNGLSRDTHGLDRNVTFSPSSGQFDLESLD